MFVIYLCQFTVSELIAFDILYNKVKCRLIVAYRPPNGDSVDLDYLKDKITSLCISHIPCMFMGDFNLQIRRWEDFIQSTNKMHISFANMLQLNYLHQYVTWPTRNVNIIDLVCCNDSNIVVDCSFIDLGLVSDHEAIMFTLLIDTIDCVLHQTVRFNVKKALYSYISCT